MPHYTYTSLSTMTTADFKSAAAEFGKIASPEELSRRALDLLRKDMGANIGAQVDLYEHALQSATRAHRDGADEETVVVALLHDIGEILSPSNHGDIPAALLRPYISDQNHWILRHHEIFQAKYYQDAAEMTVKDSRERFRDHPHFAACEKFCGCWDQTSFDPKYESLPLEFFEPMVLRLFQGKTWQSAVDPTAIAKKEISEAYPESGSDRLVATEETDSKRRKT